MIQWLSLIGALAQIIQLYPFSKSHINQAKQNIQEKTIFMQMSYNENKVGELLSSPSQSISDSTGLPC